MLLVLVRRILIFGIIEQLYTVVNHKTVTNQKCTMIPNNARKQLFHKHL